MFRSSPQGVSRPSQTGLPWHPPTPPQLSWLRVGCWERKQSTDHRGEDVEGVRTSLLQWVCCGVGLPGWAPPGERLHLVVATWLWGGGVSRAAVLLCTPTSQTLLSPISPSTPLQNGGKGRILVSQPCSTRTCISARSQGSRAHLSGRRALVLLAPVTSP